MQANVVLSDADRKASRAYFSHHFNCDKCKQAGRLAGARCIEGALLWSGYQSPIAYLSAPDAQGLAAASEARREAVQDGAALLATPDGNHGGYFSGAKSHD